MFHFTVDADCRLDYLSGADGGYVNAVGSAASSGEFVKMVFKSLCDRQLTMVDISPISEISRASEQNLSNEWSELSGKARASGEVEFTQFHLYGGRASGDEPE